MKFRKKPVVIEAIRYTGENSEKVDRWMQARGADPLPIPEWRKPFPIATLEGVMLASPGDWIIQGVAGEFYPCKPDIFAKTYEPVERGVMTEPEPIFTDKRPKFGADGSEADVIWPDHASNPSDSECAGKRSAVAEPA